MTNTVDELTCREDLASMEKNMKIAAALRRITAGKASRHDRDVTDSLLRELNRDELLHWLHFAVSEWSNCERKLLMKKKEVAWIVQTREGLRDRFRRGRAKKIGDASHAANVLHSAPGGTREKVQAIRTIWATGKYTSKTRCAEEECGALGMSLETARKALRNQPDPANMLKSS